MVLDKNPDTFIAFDIEKEWKKVQGGSPMPMSCVVVKSDLINNNKEDVESFLNLYKESIDWVNNNISEAAEIIEKNQIGMDAETAQQAIPRCNIEFTDASMAKEMVQDYLQIILDFSPEDVGGKLPDGNFYY
jgi:NitT/TauT family transport system substrate-binding protein